MLPCLFAHLPREVLAMTWQDILQIALYFGLLIIATPILGGYIARLYTGKPTLLSPIYAPWKI